MTINQTIDGVTRELVKITARVLDRLGYRDYESHAEIVVRALLDETTCPKCNDTGEVDSGGIHPWGENINTPCDCKPQGVLATCVTLQQVLKAYDYAESHPRKHLHGTANWCAAVAHSLNTEQPAPVALLKAECEVLRKDAERYRYLRKVTPYRFKKMQDAAVTDGGDVLYFHQDRFDALVDAEIKGAAQRSEDA